MENSVVLSVIDLISDHTGIKKSKLTEESTLGRDIGLDGDDAVELFEKLKNKFDVDFSALNMDEYFAPEHDLWGMKNLFNKLFRKEKFIDREEKEIRISDIVNAIKKGYW